MEGEEEVSEEAEERSLERGRNSEMGDRREERKVGEYLSWSGGLLIVMLPTFFPSLEFQQEQEQEQHRCPSM